MRSSIADYEIIEALPPAGGAEARWLCRPPTRLELGEKPVMVTELPVGEPGWRDLAQVLSRLASVRSEHLLTLFEVGPDLDPGGAGAYLVSEAAPDGTVADPRGELDGDRSILAVSSAAKGAHALHESGLMHGSIGVSAILLTDRGAVLGPPRFGGRPGEVIAAKTWLDIVTIDPEVLRGEPPSRSSDLWALAATLHGLLSPRPLYPGIEDDALLKAVQRVMFSRPEVDPALSADITAVLGACFTLDPADRPPSAAALAASLTERVLA